MPLIALALDLPPGVGKQKRDEIRLNRHRALALCLSMIFSENRFTLFRIMLLPALSAGSGFRKVNRIAHRRVVVSDRFTDPAAVVLSWHAHAIAAWMLAEVRR